MAQKKKSLRRRVGSLARRYGLMGRGGAVAACIVLVAALAGVGIARMSTGSALTIERSTVSHGLEAAEGAGGSTSESEGVDAKRDGSVSGEQTRGDEHTEAIDKHESVAVVVHVDGAVAQPGVYAVEKDTPRVNDAIEQAGGLRDDADTSVLNLASPLQDGQKVHVPRVGEEPAQASTNPTDTGTSPTGEETSGQSPLININTATEEELQKLPGVGPATAAAIVEERESNGPYTSPEDLMRVSGIAEKRFSKLKDLICV